LLLKDLSAVRYTFFLPLLFSTATFLPAGTSETLTAIRSGDFSAGAKTQETLRIVDWNIDRGTELDGIVKALEHDSPDLCVLQEVDLFTRRTGKRDVADEIARRMKFRYTFAAAWQELSQGTSDDPSYQGQAILTRLPIRKTRVIRFDTQSGFWQPRSYVPNLPLMQRRLGGRIALVAELEFRGKPLVVYNAHLESRSGGRLQNLQLDEILADAKQYPEGTPIVLAGDLNTKYNAGAVSAKLRAAGWQSAFGSHTPRTHKIICSLDWILVRGPVSIEGGRVEHDARASDHFPVSAVITPVGATKSVRATSY
jgi:endonuclease/exonuclease/phosphatase family metal-dependent hydrolase